MGDQLLLLEKPQPELHVLPKKIKDGLIYRDEAVLTDLTAEQITRMEQAPLKQRDELKRDLFMEDVQRDDSSVKFYTGLPSLSCLPMLFDFLCCKLPEILGWQEQDTSRNTPGKAIVINNLYCSVNISWKIQLYFLIHFPPVKPILSVFLVHLWVKWESKSKYILENPLLYTSRVSVLQLGLYICIAYGFDC